MKETSMKETTMKGKQPISKIELMHKRVVISPNSAIRRSIKITPTTTNQNPNLESFFGLQSQADIIKLIILKALLPLGLMQFNRFYLT
jgi:hypothetical protein